MPLMFASITGQASSVSVPGRAEDNKDCLITRLDPQTLCVAGVPGILSLPGGVVHLVVGV